MRPNLTSTHTTPFPGLAPSDQEVLEAFVKAPDDMLRLEHGGSPWNREKDGTLAKDLLGQGPPLRRRFARSGGPGSGPAA